MRLIKIGMASLDTTVGAVETNTEKIIRAMIKMDQNNCHLGCFQEQVIAGYPAEDWVQWPQFIKAQFIQLCNILNASLSLKPIFCLGLTMDVDASLYNCQAVIWQGKILGIVPKEKLPTYDIFYEGRTFTPGLPYQIFECAIGNEIILLGDLIFKLPFGTMAVEICEDIWTPDGPMKRRAYSGAELIINASASPFRIGVEKTREEMLATRSADNQATVVYINQFGGNDSLVFDGGSYIFQCGKMIHKGRRWQENLEFAVIDLDQTTHARMKNTTWRSDQIAFYQQETLVETIFRGNGSDESLIEAEIEINFPGKKNYFLPDNLPQKAGSNYFEELMSALQTGLDGYYRKTNAFKGLGIALSGGKDSVLTLLVAWRYRQYLKNQVSIDEATAANFIKCFSFPTRFNSQTTQNISRLICQELRVQLVEIPIEDQVQAEIAIIKAMNNVQEPDALTKQNIQARIRGQHMLNWANATGAMWLQTGNMSEKAVGYTTIGGDMMGAYSLISNLPKTVISKLLEYLQQLHNSAALDKLLTTKASAELADNQEDERDLMPFPVLDACIHLFASEKMTPDEMIKALQDQWTTEEFKAMYPNYEADTLAQWVNKFIKLFHRSIFKWVLTPEGVHLGSLELDRERALQLPVVTKLEWLW